MDSKISTLLHTPKRTVRDAYLRIAIIGISGYAQVILEALLEALIKTPGTLVAATVINVREEAEACRQLQESLLLWDFKICIP